MKEIEKVLPYQKILHLTKFEPLNSLWEKKNEWALCESLQNKILSKMCIFRGGFHKNGILGRGLHALPRRVNEDDCSQFYFLAMPPHEK